MFRFVVIGDSRSQKDLWEAIVEHIDRLDPASVFVINSGDVGPEGITQQVVRFHTADEG